MRKNSEDILNARFIGVLKEHHEKLIRWRMVWEAQPVTDGLKHLADEMSSKVLEVATSAANLGLKYGGRDDEYADELHALCMAIIQDATELRNSFARVRLA